MSERIAAVLLIVFGRTLELLLVQIHLDRQESGASGGEKAKCESERTVLGAISEEWAHTDDIIERAGIPVPATFGALTVLTLGGLVRRDSGSRFSLCGV